MSFNTRRTFISVASALAMAPLGGALASTGSRPKKPIKAAVIFSVPNPGASAGWDAGSYAGVQELIKNHGWEVTVAEAVPFPRLAETAANYARSGYDVVIFTSSGHIGAWNDVAPKFPGTTFAMMSVVDKLPAGTNVMAFSLDVYGYGVIGGMVAALASKTGKIAAVGGAPVPGLVTWMSGIIEGAKAARPGIEVLTAFSGDWVNVPRAREVTAHQIKRGADIVVMNAGGGTRGVLDAVEAAGALSVGYATDLYSESNKGILTSVVMNIPTWYVELAQAVAADKADARMRKFGPATFSVADMHGKVSPTVEQRIRETVGRYQRGEMAVPVVSHSVK
ncbi:MAG: BMP family ABC transporter substrate-binding protein [Pseudomonadota bacterium]|nr:BMP family ABC transporter substrate-binding protein [Pseudomonadota bacterium]